MFDTQLSEFQTHHIGGKLVYCTIAAWAGFIDDEIRDPSLLVSL